MAGVVLVYLGFVACLTGGVALFIRRRTGLATLGAALLAALVGFNLPAPERRAAAPASRLDEVAPAYQFNELHTARVAADCARSYQAIKQVTAPEITLFRTLTWMRRFGRPGPESLLNAPERIPLLEVATRSGFLALADLPNQEIVIGTVVIAPPDLDGRPRSPEEFAALNWPGVAKAAMNFRLTAAPGAGCLVSTETRVYATDAAARRRFARYWRVIYPGSALIRRMWLRAVKRRAERSG
jgi:hypothetical protein